MRLPLATALLALMHLPFTFAQATEPGSTAMGPLLQAIHERLALADQVALSKWDSGKAVEDAARERQVIANARARAPAFNLDPDRVERLFRAQIEASKQVQNARLSQWRTAGRAPDTPGRTWRRTSALNSTACRHNCFSPMQTFNLSRQPLRAGAG